MIIDSFVFAVRALARHKLRTTLTMLGVIIGVAAVMTMVALGSGAQAAVEDELTSAGTNLVYISAGNYTRGGDHLKVASGLGSARTLVHDDGVAIAAEVSGIKQWSAGISDRAPMAAGDRRYFGRLVGAMPSFAAIHGWTLGQGAMFEDRHVADRAAVAVIGTAAAAALFGGQPPVGRTFLIRNQTFTVAGVTDSTIEDHAASVFVPFTALQAMRGGTHLDSITIAAERAGETSRIADQAAAVLRVRHRIGSGDGRPAPGVPDDFTIKTEAAKALTKGLYTSAAVFVLANLPQLDKITLEEMTGTLQQTSNTLTALLASIAAISLVVGGIGIMNIMLVSVTERTREIGLRMAVGARGRDVMIQFLVEAVTLSVAGGVIGVALGYVAAGVTTRLLDWRTVVSASGVALALGTALGIGIFFGFYPARRAAQLDPIDALRFE